MTFASLMFAQDIIITTDSRKIEAKILEVSKMEIKYKEYNDLEGPTFILPTTDINSIIYSSGKIEAYNQIKNNPQPLVNTNTNTTTSYVIKRDNLYYLGDKKMTEFEYSEYIQLNCIEAWESYNKGWNLWIAGWACLGAGIGCSIVGSASWTLYYLDNNKSSLFNLGWAFSVISGACLTASIPLLIVGGIKKNNSHEVYNEYCVSDDSYTFELDLQSSQNGVGFAFKF